MPKGFFNSNGGFEYNLLIVAVATALAFTGPGVYSLASPEALAGGDWKAGVGALVAGFILGGGALVIKRPPAPATTK